MCPVCITVAVLIAGSASAVGLAAAAKRESGRKDRLGNASVQPKSKVE